MSDAIVRRGTQCMDIIEWFEDHDSLTQMQATIHLKCLRLAARIKDLEKMGYSFEHEMIYTRDDKGRTIHFMRYKKVS